MRPAVKLYKLGRLSYQRALSAQQALFDNLKLDIAQREYDDGSEVSSSKRSITNSLILVEHDPVYTVGIRTQQYNDNYIAKLKYTLAEHGLNAEFFKTNRGGLVTFHGPGQLVAYPIIRLGDFSRTIEKKSVRAYVRALENIIIDTLAMVGLHDARTVEQFPGVWLDNGGRKIAFIGISCKRFVTMHGISINCDCDLSWFDHIVSCGIEDKSITSIRQELLLSTNHTCNFREEYLITQPNEPDHEDFIMDEYNDTSAVQQHPRALLKNVRIDHSIHHQDHNDSVPQNMRPICYSVQHIADQFCVSFSDRLQCDLIEEEFPWDLVDCKQEAKRE